MAQELQRFGQKLRLLRTRHRMTHTELARALGYVSQGYLSELEANRKIPTVEFVLKVSRFFDVPTDQLLKDELDIQP